MDGVGEWATTSAWLGQDNQLTPLWDIPFPHSLGLLYSAFTYYTGFNVNSGEYKVMGLAPYGQPKYVQTIYDHLLDLKPDGTFRLNMDYFNYCTGLTMTNERFHAFFGAPPRPPNRCCASRIWIWRARFRTSPKKSWYASPGPCSGRRAQTHLCLAGGVALNCVGNGKILRDGPFQRYLDSAGGWGCWRCGGRRAGRLAPVGCATTRPRTDGGDGMQGPSWGRPFATPRSSTFSRRKMPRTSA